jgi:septal ring-binding cell division protein DamX
VNPELYTVQVIGSHSKEKIDRFMKSGKSAQGYAWFESSYNAQPWYVVIKGIYRDRDAALGEAALVKKDTGLEPWVRSFENMNEVR